MDVGCGDIQRGTFRPGLMDAYPGCEMDVHELAKAMIPLDCEHLTLNLTLTITITITQRLALRIVSSIKRLLKKRPRVKKM